MRIVMNTLESIKSDELYKRSLKGVERVNARWAKESLPLRIECHIDKYGGVLKACYFLFRNEDNECIDSSFQYTNLVSSQHVMFYTPNVVKENVAKRNGLFTRYTTPEDSNGVSLSVVF
jgi:hypothetical protein